jgi:hypothetical protein
MLRLAQVAVNKMTGRCSSEERRGPGKPVSCKRIVRWYFAASTAANRHNANEAR